MTRWYRAYEGTVTDPKLGEAALIAGASKSVAIAAWHCLLENASSTGESGRFTTSARRVAVILSEAPATVEAVFSAFGEVGLTIGDQVAAWSRRQYESDNSTARSRKHRENKRNGSATLQGRCATPPDTEADTDTDANASGAGAPPAPPEVPNPADLKAAVFASGVPLLTASGMTDRNARSMLGRWRRDYKDGAVLDALSAAQGETPSDPVAWINRTLEARNGRDRDHRPNREKYRDPLLARHVGGGHPGLG